MGNHEAKPNKTYSQREDILKKVTKLEAEQKNYLKSVEED